MSIFSNIKILDLTRVLSGPMATRHFAQFGAEVIKIETPKGDDTRFFPPQVGDWSGYFELLNHNKKSKVIDLKSKSGLEQFYKLCKDVDVIVENFSPEVKSNLKIDFKTLSQFNPKLIYASLCGVDPSCSQKYYDIIAQGESGLISLNNDHVNQTAIIDSFAGMKLAFAISSALYNRVKTKTGLEILVSMKGCSFDLLEQNLLKSSLSGQNPDTSGDTAICPFGVFQTLDKPITLGIGNDKLWNYFVELMREQKSSFDFGKYSANQIRLENKGIINHAIQSEFVKLDSHKLINLLHSKGIPAGPVNTMLDVIDDQTNFEYKLLQKVIIPNVGEVIVSTGGINFTNQPSIPYQLAPTLNQHE